MSQSRLIARAARFGLLLLCLSALGPFAPASAQPGDGLSELKAKAGELIKQQKYTEALPLLERLAAAEPDDATTQFYLGFALIAQANSTKDAAARRALRVRARHAFVKSKALGNTDQLVDGLIEGLPPDGSDGRAFSANAEAHRLMVEAESLFGQGKLDDALRNYQQALERDPRLYEAALFSGDVHVHRGDFAQAEVWYQKAIAIDPNRETAYRYSATPLMKQGKLDAARDRYIEAYISEPYSRFAVNGLTQWAQAAKTQLAHPAIDIPTNVTFDEKGDARINLDASALLGGKDDGSFAWISYGATRSTWRKEKFARAFPQERAYRHTLAEEADALRSVLAIAAGDKKTKTLSPSLSKLKNLNDAGLLEAYILLARPNQEIARDFPTYLSQHRDKLRRYVVEYVLTGGGQ